MRTGTAPSESSSVCGVRTEAPYALVAPLSHDSPTVVEQSLTRRVHWQPSLTVPRAAASGRTTLSKNQECVLKEHLRNHRLKGNTVMCHSCAYDFFEICDNYDN